MEDLALKIRELKEKKNAVILAHYYCNPEVQDVADYLGDSLYLSQIAKNTKADIIVFCGVDFMAETAKILNPDKKVILPVKNATCFMASTINYQSLKKYKDDNPKTKIISYVNTTADVKALSDCCCTSSNAIKIINYYLNNNEKIMYVPDQNLGKYAMNLANTNFEVWNGCCPVHHELEVSDVLAVKKLHPTSVVIAHPECKPEVLKLADFVGSTKEMLNYSINSSEKSFIVCTEEGILYEMGKKSKDKEFILASPKLKCKDMKLTTLEDVYKTLLNETNEIYVKEDIRIKALEALNKMLELSK